MFTFMDKRKLVHIINNIKKDKNKYNYQVPKTRAR